MIREPQLIAQRRSSRDRRRTRAATGWSAGATRDDRTLYVLTDPDVLNNFGLRHPDNARFAVALIDGCATAARS